MDAQGECNLAAQDRLAVCTDTMTQDADVVVAPGQVEHGCLPEDEAECRETGVAAVGLTSLHGLLEGVVPAVIYACMTAIEGMFVTPVIVGRRLTLSPVFLFLWLLLMSWLWGVPGALLAVPILAAGKIVCDHVPRLHVVGKLLGA